MMNVSKSKLIPILFICFTLIVCSSGCGSQASNPVQSDTCFIYTDGLLDDLCALEYLSKSYDNAVILLQDPEGLADSVYASGTVTDESSLIAAASQWFDDVALYSDSEDISGADFYLLAPLTEFAGLLKEEPSLESKHALLMAGDSDGPDGAGEDWNAVKDIDAYRYVTENMTDLVQMTRPDCENAYEEDGYPFDAQYLDEYVSRTESINDSVCCYDLQAVALYLK